MAISSSEPNSNRWNKHDTIWMLSLYGTAIGAGILFLPINAGLHGIWPIIIMMMLAFPMTYFSHRAFCRLVLSGSANNNITHVIEEHFGKVAGKGLTLFYFITIYPILLLYSVAITNTAQSFIVNQLGFAAPPRTILAFVLILGLMSIIRFGQTTIVKFMSILVYPFVAVLLVVACYLIQYWNGAIFQQPTTTLAHNPSFLLVLWLVIPVMVFAFNHSPIISSFAVSQKERYGEHAEKKSSQILKYCHIMMVATVMFFVLSCVFSLSPADLAEAKAQNITILSYLANHFKTPFLAVLAPIIAFVAIAKSYLGHYLGAREGLHGVVAQVFKKNKYLTANTNKIELVIFFTCWLAAVLNPSILGMIEMMCGPIIAILLFLMPMYAIMKVPALEKYRTKVYSNYFTIIMGCISISAIIYKIFY